jgi:hypothetical protein
MPRRQGGSKPIEGGATLVERSEGSHGRPMVIERVFDVNEASVPFALVPGGKAWPLPPRGLPRLLVER